MKLLMILAFIYVIIQSMMTVSMRDMSISEGDEIGNA